MAALFEPHGIVHAEAVGVAAERSAARGALELGALVVVFCDFGTSPLDFAAPSRSQSLIYSARQPGDPVLTAATSGGM